MVKVFLPVGAAESEPVMQSVALAAAVVVRNSRRVCVFMEMDCEDFKLYDPLLALLPSVRNEEVLTEDSKGSEGGFCVGGG